jgi:hypothetical protein
MEFQEYHWHVQTYIANNMRTLEHKIRHLPGEIFILKNFDTRFTNIDLITFENRHRNPTLDHL